MIYQSITMARVARRNWMHGDTYFELELPEERSDNAKRPSDDGCGMFAWCFAYFVLSVYLESCISILIEL